METESGAQVGDQRGWVGGGGCRGCEGGNGVSYFRHPAATVASLVGGVLEEQGFREEDCLELFGGLCGVDSRVPEGNGLFEPVVLEGFAS